MLDSAPAPFIARKRAVNRAEDAAIRQLNSHRSHEYESSKLTRAIPA